MATAPNEESIQLFELLKDGRWHSYPVIKAEVAKRVPPGRALRAYKVRMTAEARARGVQEYNTLNNDDDRIEFGRNDSAQQAVSSWVGRGLQSWGKKENRIIRVKPGFESYRLAKAAVPSDGDEFAPGAVAPASEVPEAFRSPWTVLGLHAVAAAALQAAGGLAGGVGTPGVALGGPVEVQGLQEVADDLVEVGVEPVAVQEPVEEPAIEEDAYVPVAAEYAEPEFEGSKVVEVPPDFGTGEPSLSVLVARALDAIPACTDCGLAVLDWEIHKDWHERQGRVSEPRVDLKEFEDLLGRFQVGVQAWMLLQFSQLEGKIMGKRGHPAKWVEGAPSRRSPGARRE